MKSVSLVITILVIVALVALTLWVLQFIYLIMGWSKIKNGSFNRNINPNNIEEDSEYFESYDNSAEEDVLLKESSIADEESHTETFLIGEEGDTQQSETASPKNWILWGGIGLGLLALFLILWFALQSPSVKTDEKHYVYVPATLVYSEPAEETINIVAQLNYGDTVEVVDSNTDGEWVKVRFTSKDDVSKEGYMNRGHLMTFGDFEILEHAGFKHEYIRELVKHPWQRMAVLDYFKQNQGDSIKLTSPDMSGVCVCKEIVQGSLTFAFVAGKEYTQDVLVVYTIDDNEQPHLYSQNEMPKDAEGIKSISGKNGDIHVTLTPKQGNNAISISLDDEEMTTMPKAYDYYDEPVGGEDTQTYTGTIDGKYAIEMTLTSDGGAYYTGEYFYTKNKTPIQLRGQLTDDNEHLVLEEYVGMNMTGKFDGTLSRKRYHGTWTSADGDKSYPFDVTVK